MKLILKSLLLTTIAIVAIWSLSMVTDTSCQWGIYMAALAIIVLCAFVVILCAIHSYFLDKELPK